MHSDMESQTSSLVSNERQSVVHLLLTTLSGEEHQVIVDLQEFDRLDEFETAVLEQLPTIGGSSTLGVNLPSSNATQVNSCGTLSGTPSGTVTTFTLSSVKATLVLNIKGR